MEIVKHYREDTRLRRSFNVLAQETFGLDFENWYKMGYWVDNYNPHSVVLAGEVVANVSVNRTDMVIRGRRKRLYQLGTVMTKPEYRSRGLIRAIMAEVEKTCADADGIYLFANDNVTEFYPKFGFRPGREYLYSKVVCQSGECRMEKVSMAEEANRARLEQAMAESSFQTGCTMVDNPGLIFFYAAQFLADCVYYCADLKVWAIAEQEEGELLLHGVFADRQVTLNQVLEAFGGNISHVTLGFAPADAEGFTVEEYHEEDCHFFVRGDVLGDEKLRIPSLSHA